MSRLFGLALAAVLGVFFCAQTSDACRYNVRDVGFVNLASGPYYLFVYFDKDTTDGEIAEHKKAIGAAVLDTNISGEVLHLEKDKAHPAMELLEKLAIESFPAVVLGTREGRSRVIEIAKTEESFDKRLAVAVEDIVSSPKREEILKHVIKAYGVVLLIEGKDKGENAAARAACEGAVQLIASNMVFLPKAIENPPVLVAMGQGKLAAEEMFLWSLDLKAEDIVKPHVVVLYARMRQIGPVLTGDDLTESIISNVLSIIGADCECGLDRIWMEGMMMPSKWGSEIQTQLVKSLEFDPENPMVKMEISRILGKGPMTTGNFGDMAAMGGTPFGYQEIIVEFDEPSGETQEKISEPETVEVEKAEPVVEVVEPAQVKNVEDAVEAEIKGDGSFKIAVEVKGDGSFKIAVIGAVGICVAVIVIGLGILMRSRR